MLMDATVVPRVGAGWITKRIPAPEFRFFIIALSVQREATDRMTTAY